MWSLKIYFSVKEHILKKILIVVKWIIIWDIMDHLQQKKRFRSSTTKREFDFDFFQNRMWR